MAGTELSFAVALGAGLLSFASPCVLPLVPAYLGQLTAVAVGASAVGAPPSRWTALQHATAYVLGFGIVFTVLGVTATFAAAGLAQYMPDLRKVAGLILIVLGLSMIGVLKIPFLERTWRPLDAGASAGFATARGGLALAPAGGGGAGSGPSMGDRLGTRMTMLMHTDDAVYDAARMQAASESDPVIRRWEELMWTFQAPTPWTPAGHKWTEMQCLFDVVPA